MNPVARFVAPAVLALGLAASLLPSAPPAAAAGTANLRIVECGIVSGPIDRGDGINWHLLRVRYSNAGSADSGSFRYRVGPLYDRAGQPSAAYDERATRSLAPGEAAEVAHYVTGEAVAQRSWFLVLDATNLVDEGGSAQAEGQDNSCYGNNRGSQG